jgi:hypothetical protein
LRLQRHFSRQRPGPYLAHRRAGRQIDFQPMRDTTYKQAPRSKGKKAENLTLDLG